jgi:hypothetical protein
MYQPNQEPHSPYLSRADVCLLIEQLSPRKIGKSQFYVWLELLEEEASEPYSNWVAAQMVKFGELLNRPVRQGGTLEAAREDLRRILNTYESEQTFIEDVFHEAARRIKPQLVWVYPQTPRTGQTIEVESRAG